MAPADARRGLLRLASRPAEIPRCAAGGIAREINEDSAGAGW